MDLVYQRCINHTCRATYSIGESLAECPKCQDLLDIEYDWDRLPVPKSLSFFESRWATRKNPIDLSGIWRFRDLLPFAKPEALCTIGEGQTPCPRSDAVAAAIGFGKGRLHLQYEGLNPSGSFKDNGMAAAFSHARIVGAKKVACASTGNTSASMALYAHTVPGCRAYIFIGSGKIAHGKLSQALDYGGVTIQIAGDFDDALARVREVCHAENIYIINSVNPFRLEGQKTIMYRVLESLNWEIPDWVIVPGGNLGNCSAFGKAFQELKMLGLVKKVPRLAVINAAGADTLSRIVNQEKQVWNGGKTDDATFKKFFDQMDVENRRAKTIASAIEINRPVSLKKALRALEVMNGVVRSATDEEILDAKALIGRYGLGCEPASAASVAGLKKLVAEGVIQPEERVVCILTGHVLKDPDATVGYHMYSEAEVKEHWKKKTDAVRRAHPNAPMQAPNDTQAILKLIHETDK